MVMIENHIISASAGTGKTFALTGRIMHLLAVGVEPERMVALTFTRAAAGEIFDKLVTRLASAASDAAMAEREAVEHLALPTLTQADFAAMLRRVVSRMHLMPFGTLDSFFVRIVRTFPFEFGVSGTFAVLDDHALGIERDRIFRMLLAGHADAAVPREHARQSFREAFKRATFGKEEKSLNAVLGEFIDRFHTLFVTTPDAEAWGRPDRIWPGGCPWIEPGAGTPREAAARLEARFAELGLQERQHAKLAAFTDMAARFEPHSVLNAPGDEIFRKLLACLEALRHGSAELTVYRNVPFDAEMCALALALVRHMAGCILRARLETTAGLHEVLARYEQAYHRHVRSAGRMTFADVITLLTRETPDAPGWRLSSLPDSGPDRLHIDYRLDGTYDHWAIDEFQDTSRQQWRAVENLVDEVIQDNSGRRSFFAVGDVKQAIYGWRGGDSTLLGELETRYSLERRSLSKSWRSCPQVIATVNTVFGRIADYERFPEAVRERWAGLWKEHDTARADLCGYTALLEAAPLGTGRGAATASCLDLVAELLRETAPWTRGLSTAVLVRSNTTGRAVVEALRGRDVPAVWEGDKGIADNPAVAAFLALFRFAAHPGDTLAWEHLGMTPLRACVLDACGNDEPRPDRDMGGAETDGEDRGTNAQRSTPNAQRPTPKSQRPTSEAASPGAVEGPSESRPADDPASGAADWPTPGRRLDRLKSALVLDVLADIGAHGFAFTIERWRQRLRRQASLDAFSERRLRELIAAAQTFDATGNHDCLDFVAFVDSFTMADLPYAESVRVMTMHKCKGLDFDMVVLPVLPGSAGLDTVQAGGVLVEPHNDKRPGAMWVLLAPPKDVAVADPVLSRTLERDMCDGCYEELCILYVAMTRAKRGLYMIVPPPPKSGDGALYATTILRDTLAGDGPPPRPWPKAHEPAAEALLLHECGERTWCEAVPRLAPADSAEAAPAPALTPAPVPAPRRVRYPRRLPSRQERLTGSAGELFVVNRVGRDIGNAIHALFQRLEWSGTADVAALLAAWRRETAPTPEVAAEAERILRAAWNAPNVRHALARPDAVEVALWREKSFELILDGEWISGTFDRVVLTGSTPSHFEAAEILDFKTDRLADSATVPPAAIARHASQLQLYRRVLARLTGLDETRIALRLLFTHGPHVVSCD